MVTTDQAPPAEARQAERTFSASIVISGVRCALTYVVFPWLLPAAGWAGGAGPGLGLVIGLVAIGFNLVSIRRAWALRHRYRWPITALNSGVVILLVILAAIDIGDLAGW